VLYHLVLVGALLEETIDNNAYLKKNLIKDILAKVESGNRQEQLKQISALKQLIK
jgi:hypothetical protein